MVLGVCLPWPWIGGRECLLGGFVVNHLELGMKKIILLGICAMLVGCGDPSVDASSPEALEASLKEMRDELPPEDQKKLDQALLVVMLESAMSKLGKKENPTEFTSEMDGMTAKQIIAKADAIMSKKGSAK
jgi:hypothetical protein